MDAERFDLLTKAFAMVRSRRRVVPLLAGLPAAGALMGFSPDGSAKGTHRHQQVGAERKKKKKRKKKCKPQPLSVTCNGKCGTVLNNCKQAVTCDPCPCDPPCDQCQTCNEATVSCIPDPAAVGDACGDPGQICQADGSCACSGESCGLCRTCQDGECLPEAEGLGCGGGKLCCGDPTTCVDIKNDAANCGGCGQACPPDHVCRKAACEICVCPGENGCFIGMQEAVDAALDGDVIRVCEGAFIGGFGAFSVLDDRTLTVIGAGSGLNPNSNTLLDGGGGPMVAIASGATVTLRDLRIMDGSTAGDGGGIVNEGVLTMRDCAVSDCDAVGNGGGIANAAGATLTLIDCDIDGNTAFSGGGIYNEGSLTLSGNTVVSGNSAPTNGGGGLANVLTGSTELNNTSSISENHAHDGAGIFNTGTVVLNNASSVVENTATSLGGGILSDSGGEIELNNSSRVAKNDAAQGGGILNQNGTVTLNNSSSIDHNDATADGGGIDNSGNVVMNDGSSVDNNTADNNGGGIRNTSLGTVTLNDTSSIHNNEALNGNGGGIFNQGALTGNVGSITDNTPDDCFGICPP